MWSTKERGTIHFLLGFFRTLGETTSTISCFRSSSLKIESPPRRTNSDPDDAPQRSHLAASAPAAPRSPQPDRGPDYESAAETPLELSFTAGSSSSTFRRGQQLSEIHTEQTPVQESESNAILDNVLAQGGVWTPSRGTPTAMFMSDSILAAAVHRPFFPEDSDTDNPQRENSVGGFDAEQTSGSVKSELERSLPKNYSKIRRVEGNTPEVGNSHASSSGLTNATNGVSGSASHLAGSGPAAEEHQHSSTTRSGHHHSHGKKHDRDLQASPAGGASSAASSRSLKAELLAKSAPAPHPGFGSGRAGFWREGVAIKNTFLHIEDISMWLSKL